MFIDEAIIQRNQDAINFFNADAKFDELHKFIEMYGYNYIFNRNFNSEEELVQNYCIRSHIVNLAMEERVLPNIKSRYPGQTMVDYDEKFIVAYAYILHELCYKYKNKREFFEGKNNKTK